jgi:hypothetical protein
MALNDKNVYRNEKVSTLLSSYGIELKNAGFGDVFDREKNTSPNHDLLI